MKLVKKVPAIEVKRCFVIANGIRTPKQHRRHPGVIPREAFLMSLAKMIGRTLPHGNAALDRRIRLKARIRAYDTSVWYIAEFTPSELGVWRGAGDLPKVWTARSLAETAREVKRTLHSKSKLHGRAGKAIPGILATSVKDIPREKYLFPIAFASGTGTKGRRGLKHQVVADLDDGCMRAIALAVAGAKTIRVYYGVPKKKAR